MTTISAVIPAKDEEHRIETSLRHLIEGAGSTGITEIIVVDDGSSDHTADVVRGFGEHTFPSVRLVQHEVNRGKAASLRTGMHAAQGDIVALFDADLSVDPDHLCAAMELIDTGADVVTGKRRERTTQPHIRRLGSRIFAILQHTLVGLPFQDTQCPFKVMRREVAVAVGPYLFVDRWNFDVEFLLVARKLGFRIRELEVDWLHVAGSSIRLTPGYFIEQPRVLCQIRWRHGRGTPR